jgi:hypothetical protein
MNYTATFKYPSDVMPGVGSNRSRIDSETSGSSESSRGSGQPRRRSHRPRGCRGGSNRRRNNSSDEKGNKRINNSNNNTANVVVNENSRKVDNAKLHNKATKQPHHKQANNPLQKISILSRRTANFYPESSNKFEQDNQAYYAMTGRNEYTLPTETYDMPPFHNHHLDYPVIQPSFSDSSSEGVPDPRMFQRPRPMARRNMDGSLILPPLPANAFYNEPIPAGPNPYAMKLNNHENFQPHQQQQQQQQQQHSHYEPMYGSGFMPSNPHCANSNNNNFNQHHQYHHHLSIHTENTIAAPPMQQNSYKAERLEKQRQNVVGGSLFATSPRSFLFGLNKSAITAGGSA